MKLQPLEKYLESNEGGIGSENKDDGEIMKYSVLFLCVLEGGWCMGAHAQSPVWLFVHASCLKTGSFTGRQDVELWTLGNRAAPSEPGLKQDGFVCAITILLLPSFP